jgi:hypothetical protein
MLLFALSQGDWSFIPKWLIASFRQHTHSRESFVEACLVRRKPTPVKACGKPL